MTLSLEFKLTTIIPLTSAHGRKAMAPRHEFRNAESNVCLVIEE
jgi:hypothetical protein